MNDYWLRYQQAMAGALSSLAVTTTDQAPIDTEQGFDTLCSWTADVQKAGGTIHFAGNGASACMASHMSLDWTKNAHVNAIAHNDLAFLTALGNDFGYEHVFSKPVSWFARPGDMLATISSSGNSANILRAIAAAREKGLRVVTFSGLKPDNKSRAAGDLNFFIPAWSYGIVECAHQTLLHVWIDRFMQVKEWEMDRPQTF